MPSTGTTGAVAKKLHRHWLGIEQDPTYVDLAQQRIEAVAPETYTDDIYTFPSKRDLPRVPFGKLLERGFTSSEISGILSISHRLVDSYIDIVGEHHPEVLADNGHHQASSLAMGHMSQM